MSSPTESSKRRRIDGGQATGTASRTPGHDDHGAAAPCSWDDRVAGLVSVLGGLKETLAAEKQAIVDDR